MIGIVERWLAVKLGLLVTVAVAAGFALATALGTRAIVRSSARLHRDAASSLAASLGASLRTSMLAGDGGNVRRLVTEVKARLPKVGIRIYSADGDEVFAIRPPAPPRAQVPAHVRAVLDRHAAVATATGEQAVPILNGARCAACHEGGPVLGVLTVASAPLRTAALDLDARTAVIRDGFYRVMLAPSAPRLDEYLDELAQHVPGLRGAAVYAPDHALAYGRAVRRDRGDLVRVLTLRADARCAGCHEDRSAVDGSTLVAAFDARERARPDAVPALVTGALEQVMGAGLGELTMAFLDDVARSGTVRALTLHDGQGRLVHDAFARRVPPAEVDSALRAGRPRAITDTRAAEFEFVEPLRNDRSCQRCHGTGDAFLGAVDIRLNTSEERAELGRLQRASVFAAGITVVLVFALLGIGLYYTVIRPVRAIGAVADEVGAGRLDRTVSLDSHDEMGRLGTRVNEMVRGLRHKLELSKFVSQSTMRAVEENAGAVARGGERRRIAVVFSDIRGFTPFSEAHEPEAVVAMLNTYLSAQAEVAARHGGDIDKFVGDEMMTRFTGTDMARRAVRAAVEMVAAVEALNRSRGGSLCRIGVGVNVGDAILGAMGAELRMDYTAIGDTVNVAARLCSAAGAGEVLVTDDVQRELHGAAGLVFEALAPLRLKGKVDAVPVYRVSSQPAVA